MRNAPLHIRRKFLTAPLTDDLRKSTSKKHLPIRVGDKVKVMKGEFRNIEGKVERVNVKKSKVYVEKVKVQKKDGSEASVPLFASNLMITVLNTDDKKRITKKKGKNG